jgi:cytochrome P450
MILHPERQRSFPIGAAITLAELEDDPYPVYARLQALEPVSWIAALGIWYVTRYEDVRTITLDTTRFTTASEHSLIYDTFGAQILTTEGSDHTRYRRSVQPTFQPGYIRENFAATLLRVASRLIEGFRAQGETELRAAFAARLPVQAMLAVLGLPLAAETSLRNWYDVFERGLANFTRDPDIRRETHEKVAEFHGYLDDAIRAAHSGGDEGLLGALVRAPSAQRLSDEEIRRNVSIILFGGISTVEALILNSLLALFQHRDTLERVRGDPGLVPKAIEEALRWLSPAQSATRHVVHDTVYGGVELRAGEIVNCMLGAANRDPTIFAEPERYDIDRPNAQRHLAFATGSHACLGFHLAKAEGRVALEQLLSRLPGLRPIPERYSPPRGYEFRQPRALHVRWDP